MEQLPDPRRFWRCCLSERHTEGFLSEERKKAEFDKDSSTARGLTLTAQVSEAKKMWESLVTWMVLWLTLTHLHQQKKRKPNYYDNYNGSAYYNDDYDNRVV